MRSRPSSKTVYRVSVRILVIKHRWWKHGHSRLVPIPSIVSTTPSIREV